MAIDPHKLAEVFSKSPVTAEVVTKTVQLPIDSLNLHFKMTTSDRAAVLYLLEIEPDVVSSFLQVTTKASLLQLTYSYPFKVEKKAVLDSVLLSNRFNKSFLLPGFGYDEAGQTIFFRYTISTYKDFDPDLLLETVNLIINQLDVCDGTIEAISTGNLSFAELMESSEEIFIESSLDFFNSISGGKEDNPP